MVVGGRRSADGLADRVPANDGERRVTVNASFCCQMIRSQAL